MDLTPYFYEPLSRVIPSESWPEDILGSDAGEDSIFGLVYKANLAIEADKDYLLILAIVAIMDELELPLPLLNGISIVIGGGDGDPKHISLRVEIGVPPDVMSPSPDGDDGEAPADVVGDVSQSQLTEASSSSSLPFQVRVDLDLFSIRFSREWLTPVEIHPETDVIDEVEGYVQIDLGCALQLDQNGNVEFLASSRSERD